MLQVEQAEVEHSSITAAARTVSLKNLVRLTEFPKVERAEVSATLTLLSLVVILEMDLVRSPLLTKG